MSVKVGAPSSDATVTGLARIAEGATGACPWGYSEVWGDAPDVLKLDHDLAVRLGVVVRFSRPETLGAVQAGHIGSGWPCGPDGGRLGDPAGGAGALAIVGQPSGAWRISGAPLRIPGAITVVVPGSVPAV
ncbi:MAG: hypothetical protein IPH64_13005 [Comamonadaceae bacterium]|nr:hypothetical protein [Comamonadaceae bacterium]